MPPPANTERYKNHRFPDQSISPGVWLDLRLALSYRDVQELLCARGIDVPDEAIRHGGLKGGPDEANQRRRRRPRPGDPWPLDALFWTINGQRPDLGRAVDQDDNRRAILVQSRRNPNAAKPFCRKLRQGLMYVPRVVMTDTRKRDGAATREILPGVEHRQRRYRNNRCAHAHRPTRQRERRRPGCTSAGHAQRVLSAYGPLAQHFRPRRHRLAAADYRHEMRNRVARWAAMTGMEQAASRVRRLGRGTRSPDERLRLNNLITPPRMVQTSKEVAQVGL
jgi:putative transposase